MTIIEKIKAIMENHKFINGNYNCSSIAKELGVVPSTITRAIKRIETDNLVNPAGGKLKVPASHSIKGVSVLVDADGNVKQQWVKTQASIVPDDIAAAVREALEDYQPKDLSLPEPVAFDTDLLTVYPIADQHLGLLAWGRESGEDYDLMIGVKTLRETFKKLIARSPSSKECVILNLGDWTHSDNSNNTTSRSNNALDVDGRYFKIIQAGVELMLDIIYMALEKHEKVIVRNLPGNHDTHAIVALTMGVFYKFHKSDRVIVDEDPSEFFYKEHGKVLIGGNHGHKVKPANLAAHMAVTEPEAWGRTKFRYYFFGHIHHVTAKELNGVIVESLPSLVAKDHYHASSGYTAMRAIKSITYHRDAGEYSRNTEPAIVVPKE